MLIAKATESSDWLTVVSSLLSAMLGAYVGGIIAMRIANKQDKQQRKYIKQQNQLENRKARFELTKGILEDFNNQSTELTRNIIDTYYKFLKTGNDNERTTVYNQLKIMLDELEVVFENFKAMSFVKGNKFNVEDLDIKVGNAKEHIEWLNDQDYELIKRYLTLPLDKNISELQENCSYIYTWYKPLLIKQLDSVYKVMDREDDE